MNPKHTNRLWAAVAAALLAAPTGRAADVNEATEKAMKVASAKVAPSVVKIETVGGTETITGAPKKGGPPGYHASNLLIGTPEVVFEKLKAAQVACSFSEVTIVPQFGSMPYEDAFASTKLFAQEVLPAVHELAAPLHAAGMPEKALA